MTAFYLILMGTYLFYSKSKYFPLYLPKGLGMLNSPIAIVLLLAGTGLYIYSNEWAGGLLLAVAASSLAMAMTQFLCVLGRPYFYSFVFFVHGLVLIELVTYAR